MKKELEFYKDGIKEELRVLKLDLNEARRRKDFSAITKIQRRIDGLSLLDLQLNNFTLKEE